MLKQEFIKQFISGNPFSDYIGMEVLEVKEGYALGRVHFEDKHKNFYGSMHGGCSYALADTIGGIAALTYGYYVTTVSASMNYLLPVQNTGYVYCEARAVSHGNYLSVISVKVTDDEGKLLTDGSLTYYALKRRIDE